MGGFQLWVNLPAELKMTQPRYQDVPARQIPEVERDDGTVIRVVAGEVDGVTGRGERDLRRARVPRRLAARRRRFAQPVPRGHTAFAYVFEGEGRFGVGGDLGYRGDLDGVLLAAPADGRLRRRRRGPRARPTRARCASCWSAASRWASRSRATARS